jgi:hypothetical protein
MIHIGHIFSVFSKGCVIGCEGLGEANNIMTIFLEDLIFLGYLLVLHKARNI